jgi:hypothetical protein
MNLLSPNAIRSQVVDLSALTRRESRPMITLLLHLLRLLPVLLPVWRRPTGSP